MESTNTTNNAFEEQLQALRSAYIADLQRKLEQLRALGEQLHVAPLSLETVSALQRMIHGLAGSGATYGFTEVSTLAGRLDRYLATFTETGIVPNTTQRNYAFAVLDDLCAVVATVPQHEYTDLHIAPPSPAVEPAQPIVVCDGDAAVAEDLIRQVANFGYRVRALSDSAELAACMRQPLAAAIIDISLLDQIDHGAMREANVPLIFTAPHDELGTRLRAVRAGGKAFFAKPIEISSLVDTLDALTASHEENPYRILIVEDQALLATTYAATLQQAGMLVSTVTDPLRVMSALGEFHPDVLLLDMYMPECTGMDLATVLRQQTAYEGIPIVFLSAETKIDRQMDALRRGGDDFLTKPIQLDHLVAAVASRAERARTLRSAMVRDSLTGLYNHTTTKEHLKREVARASRQHQPIAFAMIDIDQFKAVNDLHGHVVGDHVIKSLARLLKQRLRKSDIIGRYGGEEFALILPDTDQQTAYELIEELRQRFERVRQHSRDAVFYATFSCGIAVFPQAPDQAALITSADGALYQAKNSGRNRVVSALPVAAEHV